MIALSNRCKSDTAGITGSGTTAGHTSAAITSATVNALSATISSSTNFTANVPLLDGTNVVSIVAQPTASTTTITTQRYQVVTTGTTPTTLSYDANGNVTTDESGNTYKWDALNRLTAIIYSGGTHTEFAYDGLSRRTQIVERAGTTIGSGTVASTKNYLWIGPEIAEERDASNSVTKRFFPQGEQQSGTNYYYASDHLGSVREMLNSSGSIVARYAYDPNGVTTLVSGTDLATFGFAGMQKDPESGLYFTLYRIYNAWLAIWYGRDPMGEGASQNLYSYVGNNPIWAIDPFGLDTAVIINGPTTAVPLPIPPASGGNPMGHAALATSGHGVDSQGNNPNDPHENYTDTSFTDYMKDQATRRNTSVYILHTTPAQEQAIRDYMDSMAKKSVNKYPDNCVNRVRNALSAAGIATGGTNIPASLQRSMEEMVHNGTATTAPIPQGGTVPPGLSQEFDPKK